MRGVIIMAACGALALAGAAWGQASPAELEALAARAEAEHWPFEVGPTSATALAHEQRRGLRPPANWRDLAPFVQAPEKAALPEAFDWRDHNGCTPIRAQGDCGSCWAFASVGALECAIKIQDGASVDLSEQHLVSCNTDGWGCDGGWWGHPYFLDKPDPCGDAGAVLEAYFPYAEDDRPCGCPYPHSYAIESWGYVGDGLEDIPSVHDLKWAIAAYGPITCGVSTTLSFSAYRGGVYNGAGSGEINHAVVLVGWDDALGSQGAWILRNSWGVGWGYMGYMEIEYGAAMVGFGAAFLVYNGQGLGQGPTILEQPQSAVVQRGFPHFFTIQAEGVGALRYVWEKDGAFHAQTQHPVYRIAPAAPTDAGIYTCTVWNAQGSAASTPAELVVVEGGSVPGIAGWGLAALAVALAAAGGAALSLHTAATRRRSQ